MLAVVSILLNLCLLMFPALAFPHLDSDGLSAWLLMLIVADLWMGVGARTGSRVLLVTVDIVDIVDIVDTVDSNAMIRGAGAVAGALHDLHHHHLCGRPLPSLRRH